MKNENCFIRLLAFLDRRLGKRRLRELVKNVESEPEWLRPWIRLRAESEEKAGELAGKPEPEGRENGKSESRKRDIAD